MKYKLIASDVDGTLLNSKSELTERTKAAILSTVEAGAIFVTATGRPFTNVQIIKDLFDKDMPFIVFNGAAAYLGKSEKLLFERFLEFEHAKEAFDAGQEKGISQIVWTGSRLWANRKCEKTLRYQTLSKTAEMTVVSDLAQIKNEVEGFSKVLWIVEPAEQTKLITEMRLRFKDRIKCVSSMSHFIEYISSTAGKGAALADIGKLYGINKDEMIAVGDANNDICMFEYAGLGVAVANASDEIKAAADYVTLSNDDDGVAAIIEKFILS